MPRELGQLSGRGRAYVFAVSAIGLIVAGYSLAQLFVLAVDRQWLILAALTLLTGNFTVKIPGIQARLSVSDTFVFSSVLLFGPAAGTITALLDALIISLRVGHFSTQPFRLVFNVSAVALATRVSAEVFFGVAQIAPYSISHTPLAEILVPLFLFTLSYFLLNSWLVTLALAFEEDKAPLTIWRHNFLWLSVNYFGGGSVAGLLVTYSREIDFTTLGIIVPLLLISYLTFKTSLGRIEDANKHLTQVNKMYLSTIETLAMAIDAKDQITHGHIRRVQKLAVGLAKSVGVKEDAQIKAIEAAALLHDMGKLAIPEFILNKPGRLSANEFGIMKQHANIGADILGSIQFPYPVVPIVRHHHEAWDGSGYPDKLKGVDIPLGARILSVVDCFDALTSDRPYRPALSVEDAIGVLVQRRGTMYDPLIVDRFIEAQQELSMIAADSEAETEVIDTIATKLRISQEPPTPGLSESNEKLPVKALSLLRSIKSSPAGMSLEDFGVVASRQLARLANYSALAFYCVTDNQQAIRCRYADGLLSDLTDSPEIPLGERLSGWVAAHKTPIWNSDATLDLSPDFARARGITFASSVPLVDGDVIIGVLSFYSRPAVEISVEQRVLIQSIAPLIATTLSAAMAHEELATIDGTHGADREALYTVLDAILSGHSRLERNDPDRLAIVRVTWQVEDTGLGNATSMRATIERAIASATTSTGHVIRLAQDDMLLAAPRKLLTTAGLAPSSQTKSSRPTTIRVTEIANSLELREVMGLTTPNENHAPTTKPLVH